MQQQYVEKPRKVLAEQFFDAASPPAVGVHRCGLNPAIESGPPHVHLGASVVMLHDTDWILASKWAPTIPTGVLTDQEFQDTFGTGAPLDDQAVPFNPDRPESS